MYLNNFVVLLALSLIIYRPNLVKLKSLVCKYEHLNRPNLVKLESLVYLFKIISLKMGNLKIISCFFFNTIPPMLSLPYYQNIQSMRKLSLFIATSLDGYIAKPNDDLNFLKLVEK